MPTPHAIPISLTDDQRRDLSGLARAHSTPQVLALRARIILRAADSDRPTNLDIADDLGCSNQTVACWRSRFLQSGLVGLQDAPRSGRPPVFSPR